MDGYTHDLVEGSPRVCFFEWLRWLIAMNCSVDSLIPDV